MVAAREAVFDSGADPVEELRGHIVQVGEDAGLEERVLLSGRELLELFRSPEPTRHVLDVTAHESFDPGCHGTSIEVCEAFAVAWRDW